MLQNLTEVPYRFGERCKQGPGRCAVSTNPFMRLARILYNLVKTRFDEQMWSSIESKIRDEIEELAALLPKDTEPTHKLAYEGSQSLSLSIQELEFVSSNKDIGNNYDHISFFRDSQTITTNRETAAMTKNSTNWFNVTKDPNSESILSTQLDPTAEFKMKQRKIQSRYRSKNVQRSIQVKFKPNLSQASSKILREFLAEKRSDFCRITDDIFEISFVDESARNFTRKYGYLETITKRFTPQTQFVVVSNANINDQNDPEYLREIADKFEQLLNLGYLSPSEITRFMIRSLRSQSDIGMAKKLIRKLKSKSKNLGRKHRAINRKDHIEIFDAENMFKESHEIDGKVAMIYYASQIIDFVRNGNFESLFIDGTHLSMARKQQVTLVRLHSSSTKKTVTVLYALSSSKKTEFYSKIFEVLLRLNLLTNCRFVTTDFELAIRKGFMQAVSSPIIFRFCFFHLVSACRRYSASENKTIAIENEQKGKRHQKATPHVFRLFAFLIFVPKVHQLRFFQVLKFLLRLYTSNLANEMFMDYFLHTYLRGPHSEHFYLDFGHSGIITNNFVEGVNSSLKRHNRGRMTFETFWDWMKIDTKNAILNIDEKPSLVSSRNPLFQMFAEKVKNNDNALSTFVTYANSLDAQKLGKKVRSEKVNNKANQLSFLKFLSEMQIFITDDEVTLYRGKSIVFKTDWNNYDRDEDVQVWQGLDKDYHLYFKRIRCK